MGVVHHSNYVKYFEEARVAWLRDHGLIQLHAPMGPYAFAVIDLQVSFLRPGRFEDEMAILVQGQMEGTRLKFQYAIWNETTSLWMATGTTSLVPLNGELRPVRPPSELRSIFAKESWAEVWPPADPPRALPLR